MKSAYFPICIEKRTGKPVGTIALVQSGERGQIATFGVVPSHQGRGIGSMLMERAIYQAGQLGIGSLGLTVRVENPRAIRIYQRHGFQTQPEQTIIVLVKDL
jgi:ribosomal-protein-alanine N-acetyltransferase